MRGGTARGALELGALGVVFGDIGTSPLYTVQTIFNPSDPHHVKVTTENVYGIVSLIFWAVVAVVMVTYVPLVMRADNDGEGGIMALITLIRRRGAPSRRRIALIARRARGIRRVAVLRRQHDHPGDLGALRDRGRAGRGAVRRQHRAPDHRGDPDRPVPAAAARHRRGRAAVRAGDGPLVHRDRRLGHPRHRQQPVDPQGAVPHLRGLVPVRALQHGVLLAGGGGARGDRRRGALRRHGALRPRPDHPGVAVPGVPRLHPQLPGAGRPDPVPSPARSATPSSCWCPGGRGSRW